MKRIVISSIITLIILILAATGFYYSQKYTVIHSNPINAIPSDASIIIELKNGKTGVELLSGLDLIKSLNIDSSFKKMFYNIRWLDSLSKHDELSADIWSTQKIFISAHPTKANDFDFLFTFNLPRGKSAGDLLSIVDDLTEKNYTKDEREYEDVKIHELSENGQSKYTYAISKGVFIFSKTSFLVEDAIRQLKNGISFNSTKTFTKVGTKFGANESVLIFINHYGMHDMLSGYISSDRNGFLEAINNIARWTKFSFEPQKNSILLNGLSSSGDTTDLFSSIRNQTNSSSHSSMIAPARTAFLFTICVGDIKLTLDRQRSNGRFFINKRSADQLVDSLNKKHKIDLNKLMTGWNKKEIALAITEPGSMNLENNSYAFIRTENTAEALQSLEKVQNIFGKLKTADKYRSHTINSINFTSAVPLFFGNIFIDIQQTYYTIVKDFVVFANTPANLKSLIDDFEDKKILDKEQDYQSHVSHSLLSSNINFYFNLQRGTNILRTISNEDISPLIINEGIFKKTIQSVAFSFSAKNDLTTSTGRIDFSGKISREIHLLWSSQLDTTPATPPFVIVNGENKFIAIQDNEMNLNFFNEAGKLMWKKRLDEKILSKIYYMDQYSNGECQLVFNTLNKLYLIDTQGDSVSNFPIRLPAPASNGCIVKDFDNNNNHEIFIACQNGTIYAYESSGKPLTQWISKQSAYGINKPLIPFRYNNTDYMLAESATDQYIVDRRGKIVKIKSPDNLIKKSVIVYSDSARTCTFWTLDTEGNIYSLDLSKINELNAITTTDSITDITSSGNGMNENLLVLRRNKLLSSKDNFTKSLNEFLPGQELRFMNENSTEQFRGIADIKKDKFYLLSSYSTIEDGYPVWGSSDFSIMKNTGITSDSYIVIADLNGVIYVYNE